DLLFTTRVEGLEIFSAANAVPTLFDLPFADEESAVSVLTDLRRKLEVRLNHRLLRASNLQAEMQPKIIERNGSPLTYFTAGGATGTPIVLINALAQGLRYWYRLIHDLLPQHRIVTWESRNTDSASQPLHLTDQVDDLEAILSHAGIESCHIIAWCTGPKVAVEFFQRHPQAVRSMVFLNAAFKCFSTPKTLTTEYENNLEPLFQMLDTSP